MPEIKKKNILVQKIYLYTEIDGILNNLITNLRVKYFYCEVQPLVLLSLPKKSQKTSHPLAHRGRKVILCALKITHLLKTYPSI